MTERISTLEGVVLRSSKYIFFLVKENSQSTNLQRALKGGAELFGDKIKTMGRMIVASPAEWERVFSDIRNKSWPDQIVERMDSEASPFLVVVKKDFDAFDPDEDDWRIIWFSQARNPRDSIPSLFDALEIELRRDQSLFGFLDSIGEDTGLSVYGAISAPGRPTIIEREQKTGRPGVMDAEFGVEEWINNKLASGEVQDFSHGWQGKLVDQLLDDRPGLKESFKKKTVTDALRHAGQLDKIKLS
jgi:hypothetical protein